MRQKAGTLATGSLNTPTEMITCRDKAFTEGVDVDALPPLCPPPPPHTFTGILRYHITVILVMFLASLTV